MTRQVETIVDATFDALASFAAAGSASAAAAFEDAGPAVLAALAPVANHPRGEDLRRRALGVWLDRMDGNAASLGLFGGLAGQYVGAQVASSVLPRLSPLAQQLRRILTNEEAGWPWRTESVAWEDYDLVSGPAGMILALTTDPGCPARSVLPVANHLALLCDDDALDRLRVGFYRDDRQRYWNFGRINTGMAHGVAGVAAALRAASETAPWVRLQLGPPLWRVCRWLMEESFVDSRGLLTWTPGGREGAPPPHGASSRQAWCYGAPGAAWALWESARVLDDPVLRSFAEEAMRAFCAAFEEERYIDDAPADDALAFCHGAAGTLAIADAFARHAKLTKAAILADRLEAYLLARFDEVRALAERNMTMLTGASGILAVLLTRHGGRRDWLSQFALR